MLASGEEPEKGECCASTAPNATLRDKPIAALKGEGKAEGI
jgi:hypothetical protein